MKYLISNNCTAAFIYQYSNIEFPHPFMWSTFTYYNFNKLLEEYDTIDFTNFTIVPTLINKAIRTNTKHWWDDTLSVLVDNKKLCINYIHHHCKKDEKELRRNGVNLYYYDMQNYLHNLYEKRVNRMYEIGKLEPIFIFNKTIVYTKDQFYKIAYKPTKYRKIVCFPYDYPIDFTRIPQNTVAIKLPKECHPEPKYAEYLLKNYKDLLEL